MDMLFFILIFVFGLVIGSFLNVVIVRMPNDETVLRGRSRCLACSRTLAWYELIPLLSFAALRARCRSCRSPISWQYPLVELATALLFVFTWWIHNPSLLLPTSYTLPPLFRDWFFLSILLIIFIQDYRWSIILDRVTLPALAVTLVFQLAFSLTWTTVGNLALGIAIGGGFFAAQYIISRGRWIGGGDIRLGLLMGAMLGGRGTALALILAYCIGALFASALLLTRRKKIGDAIPFGTFLTIATVIAHFFGEQIIRWYVQSFVF